MRGIGYLAIGTTIVLLFADPMVKSISSLADTINVPAFYIAFIVTPFASNAPELFTAYAIAKKKTKKGLTLIHSSVYGSVAMNNTVLPQEKMLILS